MVKEFASENELLKSLFKVPYIHTDFQSRVSVLPAHKLQSLNTCSCTAPLSNLNGEEAGRHVW